MKLLRAVLALGAMTAAVGCGMQSGPGGVEQPLGASLSGRVHGGQQPVANATVQLYAVGTGGDGSAATPLLAPALTTDANGNFSLSPGGTRLYSCTNATQVYLVATGGNPGGSTPNPNLAMMTALGPCTSLSTSGFITVNELTTVAAVQALAPYMSGYANVGSGSGDAAALANAFTLAGQLVNTSTGATPGVNVPSGYTVPTTLLNTLADIVAACINSTGGVATDTSTNCGSLFSLTTPPSSAAPTDTIGALVYLALHPTMNTGALFGLVPANAPFQPTAAQMPPDFRERLMPDSSSGYVLQVSPTALLFPATIPASPSTSQTVLISNSGLSMLTLGPIAVTGTNASDFAITSGCSGTVAAAASCSVQVTFAPTATGARSAYVSVVSSSPDSPQYVAVSGTGVSVLPARLSTGLLRMGVTQGVTRDVTLTNSSSSTLGITSVATATPYFVATSHCGASVAAGASCAISVTDLSPVPTITTELGTESNWAVDVLTVTTSDTSHPMTVLLEASDSRLWSSSNVMFPPTAVGGTAGSTISWSSPLGALIPNEGVPGFTPAPTIVGANASDFTVSNACLSNSPNGYCTLSLTFTPSGAGVRTAELVTDSSGDYIPLSGAGVSSVPTTLTFSSSAVSVEDFYTQQVTLTNPTSTAYPITLSTTSGLAETDTCNGMSYGQSVCTVTVSTTLTQTGGVQGLLSVTGSFGTEAIPVSAIVDPITDFGVWALGQTSTLTRSLSAVTYQSNGLLYGNTTGDFIGGSCIDRSGAGCGINFGFKPTATGARQGLLTAVVNPGPKQANYNFLLTGTGAADGPLLTFDVPTTPWEAGSQDLIYLYVANSGTTAVNLTNGLSISGTNAGDYSLYRGCGALAVGASCQVGLYVTPAQTGLRTATVTLTDSVSGLSFSTPITVLGTYSSALKPTLSPSPVQLPLTAVNDISAPVAVTVTRPLGDAVVGSFTPTTPDPGFVLTKSQCSADENPCVLEIVFKPTAAGSLGEYMSATDVETGLTGPVYVYGLAGVGPIASVPTSPISFSSRPAGTQSIATSVTLSNTGDAQFYPTISLGGTNPSDFLLTNGCGLVLNAGASCSISVAFAPGTSGGKMATLNISGDSGVGIPVANLPVAVSLSGTAF